VNLLRIAGGNCQPANLQTRRSHRFDRLEALSGVEEQPNYFTGGNGGSGECLATKEPKELKVAYSLCSMPAEPKPCAKAGDLLWPTHPTACFTAARRGSRGGSEPSHAKSAKDAPSAELRAGKDALPLRPLRPLREEKLHGFPLSCGRAALWPLGAALLGRWLRRQQAAGNQPVSEVLREGARAFGVEVL